MTVPDCSRTESPLHLSVKNMAPSGKNAMSQITLSRSVSTAVLVKPGVPPEL
jgi:hypothetical protein